MSASAVQQSPYYQAAITTNPVTTFSTPWPFQTQATHAFPPSLPAGIPGILAPESIIGVS